MSDKNKINKIQMAMIDDAGNGNTPLPKNGYELSCLLRNIVIATDKFYSESKNTIDLLKAKIRALSVITQIGDENGNVYLSTVKCRLSARDYYKRINLKHDDSDGVLSFIVKDLVALGAITVVNNVMVKATSSATSTIEDLKEQLANLF